MCTMEEIPGLPVVHPNVEIMQVDPQSVSSLVRTFQDEHDTPFKLQGQSHRVLKKRSLQALVSTPKRRFSLKPKKVVASTSNKNSENFYLGSKFKSIKKAVLENYL
ncbi:hypothetical protein PR048_009600 [Dryococelus australis]|uniref:Uncharacterized protein n=1 Tax=Dryococelus australis TaxID=614101 RepID=A0ABQ9I255_9NEOP|nr:hypothetical protein PR048_009600 [Dryococelus australis]